MSEILHSFEEDTRQTEMGKTAWVKIDGAQVGWDTPTNDIDTSKSDKKEKPLPTLAKMQENQKTWNDNLAKFVENNPEAEAASKNPQKTDLAKAKLDKWFDSIYP